MSNPKVIPEKIVLNSVWSLLDKFKFKLWRNNSGAIRVGNRFIKYGVASPGGSDLIGFKSVIVTQEMVGSKVAIFTAIECKNSKGGRLSPEQERFINLVKDSGGIAEVISNVDEVLQIKNPSTRQIIKILG